MANIKVLDFAKNVEDNRQRLISNIRSKGGSISQSASLNAVVAENNALDVQGDKIEVRWFDVNGALLKSEYLYNGENATPPETPTYDSAYLEFDEWASAIPYTNVYRDVDCGAVYRCKPDENGWRWTHLFCNVDDNTGYSFTFSVYLYPNSVLYVDKGDGSELIVYTATSYITHQTTIEYATAGQYVVRIYCDLSNSEQTNWYLSGSNNNYVFGNSTKDKAITKIYLGDGYTQLYSYTFGNCSNCRVINIPTTCLLLGNANVSNATTTFNNLRCPILVFHKNLNVAYTNPSTNSAYIPINANCKVIIMSVGVHGKISLNGLRKKFIEPETILYDYRINNWQYVEHVYIPEYVTATQTLNLSANAKSVKILGTVSAVQASTDTLPELYLPSCVVQLSGSSPQITKLSFDNPNLTLPSNLPSLQELRLPKDYTKPLTLSNPQNFSRESLINVATQIKDNSASQDVLTIRFPSTSQGYANNIFLNAIGEEVSEDAPGAIPLLTFITNKNWTVSF